jgi:hypothetical protein
MMKFFQLWVMSSLLFSAVGFSQHQNASWSVASPLNMAWIISGIASSENGNEYGYFLQMHRENKTLSAYAALIDLRTNKAVLFERATSPSYDNTSNQWQAGRIFLRRDPITHNWSFGIKRHAHQGFSFKVDMLSPIKNLSTPLALREGLKFNINQTGRLTGHLETGESDQGEFVAAPMAWIRHVWLSSSQKSSHKIQGELCQFNDGNAFYGLSLQEPDAYRAAVAGWRDPLSNALPMSQFVMINHQGSSTWTLDITSPKHRIVFDNALVGLNDSAWVAGAIMGHAPGFCVVNSETL